MHVALTKILLETFDAQGSRIVNSIYKFIRMYVLRDLYLLIKWIVIIFGMIASFTSTATSILLSNVEF